MLIRLAEIEDVVFLKGEISFSLQERKELKDMDILRPVSYELTIRKERKGFSIKGPISFCFELTCSRCLKEFERSFDSYIDLKLLPFVDIKEEEIELKREEMNVSFFNGDEIDLAPLIWEEVILNVPMKPLCTEKCKGICPLCGKDKNIEECDCQPLKNSLLGEKLRKILNSKGE